MSVAGVPPFLGFFAKFAGFVRVVCFSSSSVVLLILLLVGSVLRLYFYLGLSFSIFFFSFWGSGAQGSGFKVFLLFFLSGFFLFCGVLIFDSFFLFLLYDFLV